MRQLSIFALLLAVLQSGLLYAQPDRGQVQSWLEQGDQFLAEGLFESARREYDKVLDAIPPQQRPAILQKIARCFYQQGKVTAATVALKRAVLLAPHSDVTRQILRVTMESDGQGEEAREWLARLDREGPWGLAIELGADPPEDELQLHRSKASTKPPEPAIPHRVGAFRTAFSERNPLSSMDTYRERFNLSRETIVQTDPAEGDYNLAAESFEVFVPETYEPSSPAGLFVWISPANSGELGRPDNKQVLADEKLIWIGANNSGNDRWHWYRAGLALDAAHNMQKLYNIDPDRIFIAGYSGGGRVASSIAMLYPEVYSGGAFFYGSNYFREVEVPDQPGAFWRPAFPAPSKKSLDNLRKNHRFVLITGEHDFNRDETEANSREYKRDRFRNVTYIEIPGADHGYGVRGEWLKRVAEALNPAE